MITRKDFEDCGDEGHAAGEMVIAATQSRLASALAGLALIRAYLRDEPAEAREFFAEMIAADFSDIPNVVTKHLGPSGRQ